MELARPTLRGVSHRFAFFIALGAGVTMVAQARALPALVTTAIYAATLAALFGISSTYHLHPGDLRARRGWQRADHAMIFIFIAGTYTPISLLAVGGADGIKLLALVWIGAGLGALRAIAWPDAPRVISTVLYLALGWAMVWYWPAVRAALSPVGLALLFAGGACYTVGAVIYALRRPDPLPAVFGYHEVFHALVIAGSACHFALVLMVVR
ncbi:MAG: hemolysin III family protein [Deltaproteobacteria bacterium]|nr:hemolysin III family protein [Deltaproteobacteria bacterium]